MTDEDTAYARNWLRHAAGDWGNNGKAEELTQEHCLRLQLERLHRRKANAFHWLVANNDYAQTLAKQMHLTPTTEEPAQITWQDITAAEVQAKVQAILDANVDALALGKCLAAALARYATHHLGQLLPAWIKDYAQPTNVVPLRAAAQAVHAEVRHGPIINP